MPPVPGWGEEGGGVLEPDDAPDGGVEDPGTGTGSAVGSEEEGGGVLLVVVVVVVVGCGPLVAEAGS